MDLAGVDYLHYGRDDWQTSDATRSGFSRARVATAAPPDAGRAAGALPWSTTCCRSATTSGCGCKVRCPDSAEPVVDSVVGRVGVANWFEREAFDLFGILFRGHPDLRRILTDYGFIGHPVPQGLPAHRQRRGAYDADKRRVVYQPVSIEPRVLVPKVIRHDHRYEPALNDATGAALMAATPLTEIRNYTMNFGPQHPAAHGVLRLVLEMDGEVIQKADPHIGLLHRGTEKLAESKPFNQSIGYMDRLDYVSMMCNEHAYVLAIERLLGIEPPERAQYIRVMFDEITRILNHLMWLGAHGLDIGAMTVFLLCFKEREELMDVYEAVSGHAHARDLLPPGRRVPRSARVDAAGTRRRSGARPEGGRAAQRGARGLACSISSRPSPSAFPAAVDDYETLLTDNRIWKQRTVNIGVVTPGARAAARLLRARCCAARVSPGICARSSPTRSMTAWTSTFRWA